MANNRKGRGTTACSWGKLIYAAAMYLSQEKRARTAAWRGNLKLKYGATIAKRRYPGCGAKNKPIYKRMLSGFDRSVTAACILFDDNKAGANWNSDLSASNIE